MPLTPSKPGLKTLRSYGDNDSYMAFADDEPASTRHWLFSSAAPVANVLGPIHAVPSSFNNSSRFPGPSKYNTLRRKRRS
jgi:hypothetical protein